MNQLTPEYLAEIAARHGEYAHIEETQGFAPWIDRQAEEDRRDLLDHIEARELAFKEAFEQASELAWTDYGAAYKHLVATLTPGPPGA